MANGNAYGRSKKFVVEDTTDYSEQLPPVVPQDTNTPPAQQPVVPQEFNPQPIPTIPSPLDYTVTPQPLSYTPSEPTITPYILLPQRTSNQQQVPSYQYITYRGNVFINGQPAPIGTTIVTNGGGNTTIGTDGVYQLESLNTPNIEFYVNGFLASPQLLGDMRSVKQVDLYAVAGGNVSARRQYYNKTRVPSRKSRITKPRNKNIFGLKKPKSKIFRF